MDRLPPEVLEQIFAHVPLIELLVIMQNVCKTWYEIISRPKFLQWKKSYYRYKLDKYVRKKNFVKKSVEKSDDQFSDNEIKSPEAKKAKFDPEIENESDTDESECDLMVNFFKDKMKEPYANEFICPKFHLFPKTQENSSAKDTFRLETSGKNNLKIFVHVVKFENFLTQHDH